MKRPVGTVLLKQTSIVPTRLSNCADVLYFSARKIQSRVRLIGGYISLYRPINRTRDCIFLAEKYNTSAQFESLVGTIDVCLSKTVPTGRFIHCHKIFHQK